MFKAIDCCRKVNNIRRNISLINVLSNDETKKKHKRKVSETVELVTLVDQNDKILGLKPKPETEKLARKLNLSLERLEDPKYGKTHPAYKLVSTSDLFKSDTKISASKALRKLPINSRITDHDLKVKINTIKKWLLKGSEVHIAISGKTETEAIVKTVFHKMQEELKEDSRIIDVRNKEGTLKFIVLPPKKASTTQKERQEENVNNT